MTARAAYARITRDAILNGMVAALASVAATVGGAVSSSRPFHTVDRYMGELSSEEAFKRGGVAGRCPAVRIAFVSDRSVRTSIGRRVDTVEATFTAVVFSDSVKSKDDRATLLAHAETVQRLLAARRLGLEIKPLRHRATSEIGEIPHCTAYAVTFATRYHVDYSKAVESVPFREAIGDINHPILDEEESIAGRNLIGVSVAGLEGDA